MKPWTLWQRLGRAVYDRSFIIGTILVISFTLVAVLGPEIAPHNPFHRDRVQVIDGELQRAPFPPSDIYPLGTDDQGRDMLSLLLHGARQTLVIAFVATTLRLLLGLLVGTIAGWWPGGLFDRAVVGLIEFLAAIPGLILAILLVSAIGIRSGQTSFIVALSLVGWGEVTQIVRGHVLTIRNKLYILAARAIGLGSPQVLSRHVLPNLLATLLALAALEMGSVLLLLGELGFIHIFIGGGGIYVDDGVQMGHVVHYFEIPDWGAMLGTSWAYFRSLPWLPMVPALAFFVSILGFNLFGYGLQRFIEKGRFHPSGWSVLRFFAVVALLLWGARALLASSSLEAQFADMARQFDVQRVWNDIAYLTQPKLEGRPTGPGGGFEAAAYVAYQFQQAGLTPLTDGTYYQPYRTSVGRVTAAPSLTLLGENGEADLDLTVGISFNPAQPFASEGSREGELVVMGNTQATSRVNDPEGVLLLLLSLDDPVPGGWSAHRLPYAGVLWLVPDEQLEHKGQPPDAGLYGSRPTHPHLLIGESAAREMLAKAGLDLEQLRSEVEAGKRIELHTGLRARVEAGLIYEEVSAANVVGYFPAADITTQGERILVATSYTGPNPQDGKIYPGADENASAVAMALEVARLWHDIGFEPKRTVVFAALDVNGGLHFVNHPIFPIDLGDTWTVVILEGIGAGEPRLARVASGSGLARIFDQSARRFGLRTDELGNWRFFFTSWYGATDQTYSGLVVTRPGDDLSGTPADTLDHLDPGMLAEFGQIVAHYLMVLSSR